MKTEQTSSIQELHTLEPEWAHLWKRCPDASPFQSPDWLLPWLKHFREDNPLFISLRQNGMLTALAPFSISEQGWVSLLGQGVSDYLDILVDPGYPEAADELLAYFFAGDISWQLCRFTALKPAAALLGACRRLTEKNLSKQETVDEICPYLKLPKNFTELLQELSEVQARNLLRSRRLIAGQAQFRIELANRENLAEQLDAFFSLHAIRWKQRNLPGVLENDLIQAFHRDTAYRFIQSGYLRLYSLRLNAAIMASLYCFFYGQTAYYYLGGFDPEIKRLSPGTLLIGQALEDAVGEGLSEFDFLRGDEPYKYAWGAVERQTRTVTITRV